MNCKEFLSVLILVLCTNIRAAPRNKSISEWLLLKEKESHRSDLLNDDEFTFLKTCYNPSCCKEGLDLSRCQLYFDVYMKFNEAKSVINMTKGMKFQTPANASDFLCKDLTTGLGPQYKLFEASDEQTRLWRCFLTCFDVSNGNATVYPACLASWWLFTETAKIKAVEAIKIKAAEAMKIKAAEAMKIEAAVPESINKTKVPLGFLDQQQSSPKTDETLPGKSPNTAEIPLEPPMSVEVPDNQEEQVKPEVLIDQKEPSPSPSPIKALPTSQATAVNSLPKQADDLITKEQDAGPPPVVNSEQTIENQPSDRESQDDNIVDAGESQDYDGDDEKPVIDKGISDTISEKKPPQVYEKQESIVPVSDPFFAETSSNFFSYFLFGMFACIVLYVVYNNKSKILALVLEGRRSQGGRNGRKKHTAAYRKLDTNLEEAITSSTTSGRASQIIY